MNRPSVAASGDLIVLNPRSAGAEGDGVRRILAETLPHAELRVQQPGEDVAAVVSAAVAAGRRRVIAAGGDGTVSGVAQGLLHTEPALGVVPLGTGNLFARELGLPLDPRQAAELLAAGGSTRTVDVMRVNGLVSLTHIGLGLYAVFIREPEPELKRRLGAAAYLGGLRDGLDALRRGRSWKLKITVDGVKRRTRVSLVVAANAGCTPVPGLRFGEAIEVGDGRLDLCLYRGRTVGDAFRAVGRLLALRAPFPAKLEYWSAVREIRIESRRPLAVQTDLPLGPTRSLHIENLPGALRVITPSPGGRA